MKICPVGTELFHADGHKKSDVELCQSLVSEWSAVCSSTLSRNLNLPKATDLRSVNIQAVKAYKQI